MTPKELAEHMAIVEKFIEQAYDRDFRKVMTPTVSGSITLILEHLRNIKGN